MIYTVLLNPCLYLILTRHICNIVKLQTLIKTIMYPKIYDYVRFLSRMEKSYTGIQTILAEQKFAIVIFVVYN